MQRERESSLCVNYERHHVIIVFLYKWVQIPIRAVEKRICNMPSGFIVPWLLAELKSISLGQGIWR